MRMTIDERMAREESLLEGAVVAAALEWRRARRTTGGERPLPAEVKLDAAVQALEQFLSEGEVLCAVCGKPIPEDHVRIIASDGRQAHAACEKAFTALGPRSEEAANA